MMVVIIKLLVPMVKVAVVVTAVTEYVVGGSVTVLT